MNNIQVFNNPEFGDIRTVEIDGEPWFVGKDVADKLPTMTERERGYLEGTIATAAAMSKKGEKNAADADTGNGDTD